MSTSIMQDDFETQPPNEAAQPVPPRRKWLKRFAIAGVVYVIGLILLRVLWGVAAQRRLDRQIAEYQAAGQLVFASEFDAQLDAVEPSENAAVLYERAMEVYVGTSTSGTGADDFWRDPIFFRTHANDADELIQSNTEALRLVHEARNRPQVAWSDRLDTTSRNTGLPRSQRALARVLWLASAYQMRTGDHAAAVGTLADAVAYGDAIDAHPTGIALLIARACHDFGFRLIEDQGSGLDISTQDAGVEIEALAATRADVEWIIVTLLTEDQLWRNAIRASRGERAGIIRRPEETGLSECITRQTNPWARAPARSSIVNYAARPALILDALRAIQFEDLTADSIADATWPQDSSRLSKADLSPTLLNRVTHPMTYTAFGFAGNLGSTRTEQFYRFVARRRMAALALAIRMYEVDHGDRPRELAALVPAYLRVLPKDPFANQDQGFGYAPDADRPLVYSVGRNRKDDHGNGRVLKQSRCAVQKFHGQPVVLEHIAGEQHHIARRGAHRLQGAL